MSIGLTRNDAFFRGLVLVQGLSTAAPAAPSADQVRERVRDQVMAAHGVDARHLALLGASDRLRVEAAVAAETSLRVQQGRLTGTGNFVDLRV